MNIRFKVGNIDLTIGLRPIQKPKTKYSTVLADLRSAIIYALYDPALVSSIDGPGSIFGVETVASKLCQTILKKQATASLDNKTPKYSLAV